MTLTGRAGCPVRPAHQRAASSVASSAWAHSVSWAGSAGRGHVLELQVRGAEPVAVEGLSARGAAREVLCGVEGGSDGEVQLVAVMADGQHRFRVPVVEECEVRLSRAPFERSQDSLGQRAHIGGTRDSQQVRAQLDDP